MKRKHLVVLVAAVLGLALLVPEVAEAQGYGYRPQRRPQFGHRHRMHGYVGGQVMGMAIMHQGIDAAGAGYLGSGGGFGLFGGVRIGPFIGLELNWNFTAHDQDWGAEGIDMLNIQTVTADFKLHIPTRGRIEPFVQAGGGFAFLGVSGDWASDGYIFNSGPTFSLGGGADLWLSPFFTVGGRVLYRGMYYGDGEYAGGNQSSNYVSGLSFDLNAQIHF